jgi:xenotropic and polytropic retrovirus receptor 1
MLSAFFPGQKNRNWIFSCVAKYASSFFVIIFSSITYATTEHYSKSFENPFFYLWVISAIVSSFYAYGWDIFMDWGLLSMDGENKFLRDETVYSSTVSSFYHNIKAFEMKTKSFCTSAVSLLIKCTFKGFNFISTISFFILFQWFYYFAIVEDLILRFGWTLSMSLIELGYMESDLVFSLLAPLEVFRRFIWNYFRLENEHLNNCGNFRAVRDISVAPISGTSDEVMIVKMMDENDGVVNRRTKKVGKKKDRLLLNGMSESQDLENM